MDLLKKIEEAEASVNNMEPEQIKRLQKAAAFNSYLNGSDQWAPAPEPLIYYHNQSHRRVSCFNPTSIIISDIAAAELRDEEEVELDILSHLEKHLEAQDGDK